MIFLDKMFGQWSRVDIEDIESKNGFIYGFVYFMVITIYGFYSLFSNFRCGIIFINSELWSSVLFNVDSFYFGFVENNTDNHYSSLINTYIFIHDKT